MSQVTQSVSRSSPFSSFSTSSVVCNSSESHLWNHPKIRFFISKFSTGPSLSWCVSAGNPGRASRQQLECPARRATCLSARSPVRGKQPFCVHLAALGPSGAFSPTPPLPSLRGYFSLLSEDNSRRSITPCSWDIIQQAHGGLSCWRFRQWAQPWEQNTLTKGFFLQTGSFDTFTKSAVFFCAVVGMLSPKFLICRSILKLLYISFSVLHTWLHPECWNPIGMYSGVGPSFARRQLHRIAPFGSPVCDPFLPCLPSHCLWPLTWACSAPGLWCLQSWSQSHLHVPSSSACWCLRYLMLPVISLLQWGR